MSAPLYFDEATILRAYDSMITETFGGKDANDPRIAIQLRLARTIGRAAMQFIVGERQLETEGGLVGQAVAAGINNLLTLTLANWPDGDAHAGAWAILVRDLHRQFSEPPKAAGDPGVQFINGVEGGRA